MTNSDSSMLGDRVQWYLEMLWGEGGGEGVMFRNTCTHSADSIIMCKIIQYYEVK